MDEKLLKLLLEKQKNIEKEIEHKINNLSSALTRKIEDSFLKVNLSLAKLKNNDSNSEIAYLKQLVANIYMLVDSCNSDNYNESLEVIKKIKELIKGND